MVCFCISSQIDNPKLWPQRRPSLFKTSTYGSSELLKKSDNRMHIADLLIPHYGTDASIGKISVGLTVSERSVLLDIAHDLYLSIYLS
jgi:hypothetical protein